MKNPVTVSLRSGAGIMHLLLVPERSILHLYVTCTKDGTRVLLYFNSII